MTISKWLVTGAVLAVLVLSSAACGSRAARFTIEGTDQLTFVPNSITVKAGEAADLTLVNKGKLDHTWTVPDLNIEVQMPAGQTNHITFTAPKPGQYRFYCAVPGHFETMTGMLIVQ